MPSGSKKSRPRCTDQDIPTTESLNSPTTYRQLRVKWRGPRPDYPTGGLTGSSMVEKLIGNIVSEVLKAFSPVCWVVKCSSMLCDRLAGFAF